MAARYFLLLALIYLSPCCRALKCRSDGETQPNEDFEYVVRMCIRQMKNGSDFNGGDQADPGGQGLLNWNNRRDQDRNRDSSGDRDRHGIRGSSDRTGLPSGFEQFWGIANSKKLDRNGERHRNRGGDKERDRDGDRFSGSQDDEEYEDNYTPSTKPWGGRRDKQRPQQPQQPHSYQQQMQHDRDEYGGRGPQYFYPGTKTPEQKRPGATKFQSSLEQVNPLDELGKPDRSTVMVRMTQRMRNKELKNFIQDSVEECFDMVESEERPSHRRGQTNTCTWSKNFAMCLEERGKQTCDDWDTPMRQAKKDEEPMKGLPALNKGTRG